MDVRRQRGGFVERADPDEAEALDAAIVAKDRDLARWAAMNDMRPAAVGRNRNGLRLAREHLDPVGLDQRVDDEGAAGLPLAVLAVSAVHEHRLRTEPVANGAASAAALERVAHRSSPSSTSLASQTPRADQRPALLPVGGPEPRNRPFGPQVPTRPVQGMMELVPVLFQNELDGRYCWSASDAVTVADTVSARPLQTVTPS